MKTKSILLFAAGSLALLSAANGQQTINITGATAFRSAAVTTIRAVMNGQGNYSFGHNGSSGGVNSASRSIFVGTWPGLSGTTTIRCHWTGSVEGVRAISGVADPSPPTYIVASTLTASPGSGGTEQAGLTTYESAVSDLAFSDVAKASTPYGAAAITSENVGVIVFAMVANKGSVITNVTNQQYRAVLAGDQPLRIFTGVSTDTSRVVAVGRNDLSGTRTTYLAESGFGITNPVQQYIGTAAGGVLSNVKISLSTAQGGSPNVSTVWGQDKEGNGGYNSGGDLTPIMIATADSTPILDATGDELYAADRVDMVTFVSISDAGTMKLGGANVVAFNGVGLDLSTRVYTSTKSPATGTVNGKYYKIATVGTTDFTAIGAASNTVGLEFQATGVGTGTGEVNAQSGFTLSAADQTKIKEGSYTAWGFEKLFKKNSPTAAAADVFDDLKANIPANLGSAGVPISQMKVTRGADGGTVVAKE